MNHLFFLFYLISALSGVAAVAYFSAVYFIYRKSFFKDYLFFVLSYSLIMVSAIVSIYLQVNARPGAAASYIFNIGILTGFQFMTYSMPRFVHHVSSIEYPVFWKRFFLGVFFCFPLLLVLYLLLPNQFLIFFWVSLGLFSTAVIYSFFKAIGLMKKQTTKKHKQITYFIILLSPLIALSEMLFFPYISSLYGFSLSLPINYLLWNIVSVTSGLGVSKKFTNQGQLQAQTVLDSYHLTKQEMRVLELILKGQSNKEIADSLFVSPHTVKNHIYNLYQKTGVKGRFELIARFKD